MVRRSEHVVIVGAGITGLTTAHSIHAALPGVRLTVLDARERVGGNIQTVHERGYVIDAGPDSFLATKPDAVDLCRELGLAERLVQTRPSARRVYFAHEGGLEEMPGGMVLAVPTRVGPLLETPLLSKKAKMRMLSEPMIPGRPPGTDETIHDFFARRFGEEAATRLAGPLLSGVYAGDTRKLSLRATFPQLAEMEVRHGSLVRGLFAAQADEGGPTFWQWLRRSGEAHAPSPFRTLDAGLGVLIDSLAAGLPSGSLALGTSVRRVEHDRGAWRVETPGGTLDADAVVLAVPALRAAELVPDEVAAAELAEVPFASTATVFLGFDARDVERSLDGLGFVAPEGEATILAGTWVSSKWEGRAPEGKVLMRAFIGGARDGERVASATDAELVELSLAELRRLMGRLGEPELTRVFRYPKSSAQPVVGHLDRMQRVRDRLGALPPGLAVGGAGYDGVGIPDCVRQGRRFARDIVELFRADRRAAADG